MVNDGVPAGRGIMVSNGRRRPTAFFPNDESLRTTLMIAWAQPIVLASITAIRIRV